MNLLCKLGWHKWPARWRTVKAVPPYIVRICRRCGLRQSKDKAAEAREAELRG